LYTFKLEDYYISPKLLAKPMYILEELIKTKLPKVSKALVREYLSINFKEKLHINPMFYATKWFISLYTDVLPFNCVVRLIDCLLFERNKIIYRVALAILKIKQKKIVKAKSMEEMMALFKEYKEPEFFDNDDKFMKIAFGFNLSRAEIRVI
jgi:Rab-GTPase-TBC domain